MNVFFLNVGRRCELVEAFSRSLAAVSPGLIWGSDPNPLAPALASVDRVAQLPSAIDSDEFLTQLIDFLVAESIDLVIPTIDPDLVRLDRWRAELSSRAPSARLLLSPSSVIKIARDKRLSRDAFSTLGAQVPEPVDPNGDDLPFPLFVKPASGSASVGAIRIDSLTDLRERLASTVDPMLEKLVDGDETTVDVLLDFNGTALCAVPRRRLQVRGGEVTRGVVERSMELESLAMRIASGLGCTGPVTLQFRNPEPGRWVAMELNARMGGGLPLAIGAGADWPRWILQMAVGNAPDISSSTIHDGMVMTRTDRSFFLPPTRLTPVPAAWQDLPKLVIFDLDDTLYPEADFVRSGHHAIAERVWRDLKVDIEPELRRRFSLGQRGDLMTAALASLCVRPSPDYVTSILVPTYREHCPDIRTYVESIPVLKQLKARGHRLALLSDGWAAVQKRKFESLLLGSHFEKVVFTDELGRDAWKPSPKGFELICSELNVVPNDAAYVSDNPLKDFVAPRKLGMQTIRIVRPGTEHEHALPPSSAHMPDRVIRSLSDLLFTQSKRLATDLKHLPERC